MPRRYELSVEVKIRAQTLNWMYLATWRRCHQSILDRLTATVIVDASEVRPTAAGAHRTVAIRAENDSREIEAQTYHYLVTATQRLHLPNSAPFPMALFVACQLALVRSQRKPYEDEVAVVFT
ncbi:hypothetical protein EI94DRAFT_1702433 [Lactarius quietus]|nr:hypothetical protein EI94DRAFT_1702433 [Lactarius quietus]